MKMSEVYKMSYDLELAADDLEKTAEELKSFHLNHALEVADMVNKLRRWAREMRKS